MGSKNAEVAPLRGGRYTVLLLVFVLAVTGLAISPIQLRRPSARQIREQLFKEVRPIALKNCTLQRFGGRNDGGYLMCGNLLGRVQVAYSYGIGGADDWGCQVSAALGVTVHQYDCFVPGPGPCPSRRSVFHDECIGDRTAVIESRIFDTLARQIWKNGDAGKTVLLKIDVEGAELDSLLATPDRVLGRIDQIAIEIHGADRRYLQLVKKLKRLFHPAHLHFNNQACSVRYKPFPAFAYQMLFVNKRIGIADPTLSPPTLPNALDAPDYALGHDCQTPLAP